jgi:hypothetical protein
MSVQPTGRDISGNTSNTNVTSANFCALQVITAPAPKINRWGFSLNRRYIIGCISYMLLILTYNMTAECPRTDCNRLGDKIKNKKRL